MNLVKVGGRLLRRAGSVLGRIPDPVPLQYKRVSYVRLLNRCAVNTGVVFDLNDTIKTTMYYTPLADSYREGYAALFGARTSNGNIDQYTLFGKYQNNVKMAIEGQSYSVVIMNGRPDYVVTITANKRHVEVRKFSDDSLVVDKTIASPWTGCTIPMHIAKTSDNPNQCANINLYSFQMFDQRNNLKLDLIPVMRKSDSAYGLWDAVGKRFVQSCNSIPIQGPA